MIIDCIADLHGFYPELEGGDLLIVAGDLTAHDDEVERKAFEQWLGNQKYKKCIFIAGNHDNSYQFDSTFGYDIEEYSTPTSYLCDSGTEFVIYPELSAMEEGEVYSRQKLKIWGSPWTKRFPGMNPRAMAFTVETEEELAEKWALIPEDTDILVTHGPPHGILDAIKGFDPFNSKGLPNAGSFSLLMKATSLPKLKLFCFGHIHEEYGMLDTRKCQNELKEFFPNPQCKSFPFLVNASHVNERYEPVNKPIRVIL